MMHLNCQKSAFRPIEAASWRDTSRIFLFEECEICVNIPILRILADKERMESYYDCIVT